MKSIHLWSIKQDLHLCRASDQGPATLQWSDSDLFLPAPLQDHAHTVAIAAMPSGSIDFQRCGNEGAIYAAGNVRSDCAHADASSSEASLSMWQSHPSLTRVAEASQQPSLWLEFNRYRAARGCAAPIQAAPPAPISAAVAPHDQHGLTHTAPTGLSESAASPLPASTPPPSDTHVTHGMASTSTRAAAHHPDVWDDTASTGSTSSVLPTSAPCRVLSFSHPGQMMDGSAVRPPRAHTCKPCPQADHWAHHRLTCPQ